MPTTKYKVIFQGEILPNIQYETVEKRFMELFKLPKERVSILLSSQKAVLKENIDLEAAQLLKKNLKDKIGIITYIESYTISDRTSLEDRLINKTYDDSKLQSVANTGTFQKNKKVDMEKINNQSATQKSLYVFIPLLILLAVGGFYGYNKIISPSSTPNVNTDSEAAFSDHQQNDSRVAKNEIGSFNQDFSSLNENTIIPKCSDQVSASLIGKLLIQGFPAFIQQNNPNITLTFNKIHINEEIYFDLHRNKRLCTLHSEYSALDENTKKRSNLAFEIVYEIYYDADKILNITTFKHQLLGVIKDKSNLDSLKSTTSAYNTQIQ